MAEILTPEQVKTWKDGLLIAAAPTDTEELMVNTIDALAAALRAADRCYYPNRIGTHWEGCEKFHPWCDYAKKREPVKTWLKEG